MKYQDNMYIKLGIWKNMWIEHIFDYFNLRFTKYVKVQGENLRVIFLKKWKRKRIQEKMILTFKVESQF